MLSLLLDSLVVMRLDLRLDGGRKSGSRLLRLVLGWYTVFGWVNHLSISLSHPGQLSLLPSVRQKMSTSQS